VEFFCPFCRGTIKGLKGEFQKLVEAHIDVVIASADLLDAAKKLVAENDGSLPFPVGYGLTVDQLKTIGTYISSPTHYIEQKHQFSEPAWFLLTPEGKIKYLDYGSAPFTGRPVVDNLIAGHNFSEKRKLEVPEFGGYVWGSVPNH